MGAPLKLVGSLLVTASLVVGAMSAATAYLVPIDRIDPAGEPVTLHAPAGRSDTVPPQPILRPGPRDAPLVLTADHLTMLRDAGVDRVHLKEFSFARWRENWIFALALAGLFAGGMLLRSARRQAQAAERQEGVRGVGSSGASIRGAEAAPARPAALLDAALEMAKRLRSELDGAPASVASLGKIRSCIERMQAECFDPFVEKRTLLVEELGMAGYARLMDPFAAAERQFNRAWSAAADHVPEEAVDCFARGIELLEEARSRVGASSSLRGPSSPQRAHHIGFSPTVSS